MRHCFTLQPTTITSVAGSGTHSVIQFKLNVDIIDNAFKRPTLHSASIGTFTLIPNKPHMPSARAAEALAQISAWPFGHITRGRK